MAKGLYLRLYSSIVENPKIHHLADILGCSYADALYVLIKNLVLDFKQIV